jgi:hypothetical protein
MPYTTFSTAPTVPTLGTTPIDDYFDGGIVRAMW